MLIVSQDGKKRINFENVFSFEIRKNNNGTYEIIAISNNGVEVILGVCFSGADAEKVVVNLDKDYEDSYNSNYVFYMYENIGY